MLLYLLAGYLSAPVIVFGTWPALLYFLFIIISTLRLDFALSAFTGAVAAVELFVLAFVTLHLGWQTEDPDLSIGYHLDAQRRSSRSGPLGRLCWSDDQEPFRRALAAASARDDVTNLFGQHVSPQVVERLLAIGAAELSEMRRVCVMFVDIRSFTTAARTRTPAEVVQRLDDVFEILVDVVDRHNGIVNKFLGDGLLAIFGAPIDDPLEAANAVAAAREILGVVTKPGFPRLSLNDIGSGTAKFFILLQNIWDFVRVSPLKKHRQSDAIFNRLIGPLAEMGEHRVGGVA